MEIKLDSEAWGAVASAAIFDQMSVESRDMVIKQAVQYLLTPEQNRGFGKTETPLQMAFNQALHTAAFRAVEQRIKDDPELAEAIDQLLGPLISATLKSEAERYDSTLSDAIGRAIGQWLADKARS